MDAQRIAARLAVAGMVALVRSDLWTSGLAAPPNVPTSSNPTAAPGPAAATGTAAASSTTAAPGSSLWAAPDGPPSRETVVTHGAQLLAAALGAHRMIRTHGRKERRFGLATTMAALWVVGGHAVVANVGDSRVYRLTNGYLELLTKDHTALQEYVDAFGPGSAQAKKDLGHIVTQVLGGRGDLPPEVRLEAHPLRQTGAAPETFLLCTDGLHGLVDPIDIAVVLEHATSAQHAASALVELANTAGGADNITCVVVRLEPPAAPPDVAIEVHQAS